VSAVAIAPDGAWLASGGDDGAVRIWDPATGELRAALTDRANLGRAGPVRALAIAPDGTWLACAYDDGAVRIWDPVTGGISAVMRVDSQLEACAWSPSSQSLAAAGGAGLYHFTFKP
jgi:WD40 repeat protein